MEEYKNEIDELTLNSAVEITSVGVALYSIGPNGEETLFLSPASSLAFAKWVSEHTAELAGMDQTEIDWASMQPTRPREPEPIPTNMSVREPAVNTQNN